MATNKSTKTLESDQSEVQHVHTEDAPISPGEKKNHEGIVLVPQPSDDLRDPLVRL
jgi:hypothetical protein